jgi:hypothetical protein
MRTWAIACYTIGAVAELGALVVVIIEFWESRSALRTWNAANPEGGDGISYGQMDVLNKITIGLLGKRWRQVTAVALIFVGIVAGTLGNFASLPKSSAGGSNGSHVDRTTGR